MTTGLLSMWNGEWFRLIEASPDGPRVARLHRSKKTWLFGIGWNMVEEVKLEQVNGVSGYER